MAASSMPTRGRDALRSTTSSNLSNDGHPPAMTPSPLPSGARRAWCKSPLCPGQKPAFASRVVHVPPQSPPRNPPSRPRSSAALARMRRGLVFVTMAALVLLPASNAVLGQSLERAKSFDNSLLKGVRASDGDSNGKLDAASVGGTPGAAKAAKAQVSGALQLGFRFGVEGRDCQGVNLADSKYCSGFSDSYFGPSNIVPGVLFLNNKPEDSQEDAKPLIDAGLNQITSSAQFDKAFEDFVLKKAFGVSARWSGCPYANRGVHGLITYSCQWIVNYGFLRPGGNVWFQETCTQRNVSAVAADNNSTRPAPPGLCLSTTKDFIKSIRDGFGTDESCNPAGRDNMEQLISQYESRSLGVSNRNDTSRNCISVDSNEGKLGLCGYTTEVAACLNNCKLPNCNTILRDRKVVRFQDLQQNPGQGPPENIGQNGQDGAAASGSRSLIVGIGVGAVFLVVAVALLVRVRRSAGSGSAAGGSSTMTASRPPPPKGGMVESMRESIRSFMAVEKKNSLAQAERGQEQRRTVDFENNGQPQISPRPALVSPPAGPPEVPKPLIMPSANGGATRPSFIESANGMSRPSFLESDMSRPEMAAAVREALAASNVDPPEPNPRRSSMMSRPLSFNLGEEGGPAVPQSTYEGALGSPSSMNSNQRRMFSLSQARVVLFPFVPTRDDEIELKPGDMVQISAEYDDGWGAGSKLDMNGRPEVSGAFPLNCFMVPSIVQSTQVQSYVSRASQ